MKILDLPEAFYASVEFEPQRVDYTAPEAGGRMGGVQAGFPLWLGVWTIDVAGPGDDDFGADALRAFFSGMRGQVRRFLGRDVLRLFPKAHKNGFGGMLRAGGGAFDGSATSWAETLAADGDSEVTLTNLPVGLVLGTGDYIGFNWVATEASVAGLTWHSVVRVVVGGTADGTGSITVTSEPPVPSAVPAGATAYLNQPVCTMVLITERSSLQATGRGKQIRGGQITGVQDIRA